MHFQTVYIMMQSLQKPNTTEIKQFDSDSVKISTLNECFRQWNQITSSASIKMLFLYLLPHKSDCTADKKKEEKTNTTASKIIAFIILINDFHA